MAVWPTVSVVKTVLGVTTDAKDAVIADAVGAAIEQVVVDCGYNTITVSTPEAVPAATGSLELDADDEPIVVAITPTHSLSQAALILAVMSVKAPDAPYGVAAVFDLGGMRVAAQHPTYQRLLTGHRFTFGVS